MTLALIIAIYFMLKIIFSLRRGVLSINFVWLWGVLGIAFLASLIFRKQIQNLSESLGFVLASNAVIVLSIAVLSSIIIDLAIAITKLQKKIENLIIHSAIHNKITPRD